MLVSQFQFQLIAASDSLLLICPTICAFSWSLPPSDLPSNFCEYLVKCNLWNALFYKKKSLCSFSFIFAVCGHWLYLLNSWPKCLCNTCLLHSLVIIGFVGSWYVSGIIIWFHAMCNIWRVYIIHTTLGLAGPLHWFLSCYKN